MAETNLIFSKIVATPTPTAWSQAYSAGKLFAAISLQTDSIPQTGGEHLNALGKDLISTLESEFFTLENKDLESIKQAVNTTIARVGQEIRISLIVCYLSENVLYLFATGGGKAVLKRGEKIGTVLVGEDSREVKSASGYVQEEDVIVLQTKPFQRIISSSTLASSLDSDNPEEITEAIAPHVHDKSEGGASSVVLVYKKTNLQNIASVAPVSDEKKPDEISLGKPAETGEEEGVIPVVDLDEPDQPDKQPITPLASEAKTLDENLKPSDSEETTSSEEPITKLPSEDKYSPFLSDETPKKKKLSFPGLKFPKSLPVLPKKLSHSRKIILTIAIALVVVLALASFLALRNRGASSDQALFDKIYAEAKTKYDEGQNLKDLNAPLALESFREAKNILEANRGDFEEDSDESRQILSLLDQVNNELSGVSGGNTSEAKEVEASESDLLSYAINNTKATHFVENEASVFFLDGSGISEIEKSNDSKNQIIKKDWDEDGGIGLFGSNIYVLDKAGGIIKFVPSGNSYSQSNYFTGDGPDMNSAVSMAIDGSVYVLFENGEVNKYTRGASDTFNISGLEKPFSSPTKIFTNEDIDNIYILDNGNSRIVVLDKTGKFVSAYASPQIKSAKEFNIDEAGKKAFILSGGKVYQIDLN